MRSQNAQLNARNQIAQIEQDTDLDHLGNLLDPINIHHGTVSNEEAIRVLRSLIIISRYFPGSLDQITDIDLIDIKPNVYGVQSTINVNTNRKSLAAEIVSNEITDLIGRPIEIDIAYDTPEEEAFCTLQSIRFVCVHNTIAVNMSPFHNINITANGSINITGNNIDFPLHTSCELIEEALCSRGSIRNMGTSIRRDLAYLFSSDFWHNGPEGIRAPLRADNLRDIIQAQIEQAYPAGSIDEMRRINILEHRNLIYEIVLHKINRLEADRLYRTAGNGQPNAAKKKDADNKILEAQNEAASSWEEGFINQRLMADKPERIIRHASEEFISNPANREFANPSQITITSLVNQTIDEVFDTLVATSGRWAKDEATSLQAIRASQFPGSDAIFRTLQQEVVAHRTVPGSARARVKGMKGAGLDFIYAYIRAVSQPPNTFANAFDTFNENEANRVIDSMVENFFLARRRIRFVKHMAAMETYGNEKTNAHLDNPASRKAFYNNEFTLRSRHSSGSGNPVNYEKEKTGNIFELFELEMIEDPYFDDNVSILDSTTFFFDLREKHEVNIWNIYMEISEALSNGTISIPEHIIIAMAFLDDIETRVLTPILQDKIKTNLEISEALAAANIESGNLPTKSNIVNIGEILEKVFSAEINSLNSEAKKLERHQVQERRKPGILGTIEFYTRSFRRKASPEGMLLLAGSWLSTSPKRWRRVIGNSLLWAADPHQQKLPSGDDSNKK